MQGLKAMRKLVIPCGLIGAAIPLIKPSQDSKGPCCHEPQTKKLIRPSELPIYSTDHVCASNISNKTGNDPSSALEQSIGEVRKMIQKTIKECQGMTDIINHTVDTGIAHSQSAIDYLHEESNIGPRLGAIGMGGLTGLILGLRGGTFKRIFYASNGALIIGVICYPKLAEEGFETAKHYVKVGYNFIYGVKPGDDSKLEIPSMEFPSSLKFPSTFSEFSDLVIDLGSNVVTAIGGLANQTTTKTVDEGEKKPKPDSKSE